MVVLARCVQIILRAQIPIYKLHVEGQHVERDFDRIIWNPRSHGWPKERCASSSRENPHALLKADSDSPYGTAWSARSNAMPGKWVATVKNFCPA
jgi:hypothetical protein